MQPTFENCTLTIADNKILANELIFGDIVIVNPVDDPRFAHRVVSNNVEEQVFSTRGDNDFLYDFPSSVDGFFGYDKYLGKVEHYYSIPNNFCEGVNGE